MAITKLHQVLTYLQKNKKLTTKQISEDLNKDLETTQKMLNGTKRLWKKDVNALADIFGVDYFTLLVHWQIEDMERIINANMQLPDDPDKILSNVTEMLKKTTKELSKIVLKLYRNNLKLDIKKI